MNFIVPQAVELTPAQAESLERAATAAHPHECCGLLIGEGSVQLTVTEVAATDNVAENPADSFAIDPQAQFALLRATRATGRRVVGHYHSHPRGPAVPSVRDLAMAHDPEAVWIVIDSSASGANMRAFCHPTGMGRFVEVPIMISPSRENPS